MTFLSPHTPVTAALRSISLMAEGDRAAFAEVFAPDAVNREARAEPPACRTAGPDGFHASAIWLRSAFTDLAHRVEHVVTQDDLVVVDTVMSGRHTGPFVVCAADGTVERVWAPTGQSFAVQQTHWLRVVDGLIAEHWAARDDLGLGTQLGWIPPTPMYLWRCAREKRRAIRRAAADRPSDPVRRPPKGQ